MSITLTPADVTADCPRPEAPKAIVGVIKGLNYGDMTPEIAELSIRFARVALQQIADLDCDYDFVDVSDPDAQPDLDRWDGVLLLGGGDIHGSLYGGPTSGVPHSYGVNLAADVASLEVIHGAIDRDLPVFGICRGSQLINVAYGGTVVPDLEDFTLHHGGPGESLFLDEDINLMPGSRVAQALSSTRVTVRSGHHQAVDRPGDGLVVTAQADDGVIEGFEDPQRWVVGVQWHPEDDDGSAEDRRALFAAFTHQAILRNSTLPAP